jgi:hypothetical protein
MLVACKNHVTSSILIFGVYEDIETPRQRVV